MTMREITKITFTTKDGVEHVHEGEGKVDLITTYRDQEQPGKKQVERIPVARLEVTMPVPSEYRQGAGDIGRYIATPTVAV